MKAEYINPFITSVKQTFETMLDCQLERSELFASQDHQPKHEITGVIGLTGRAEGKVALSLSRDVAIQATRVMLQEEQDDINDDVADAVGELANMVAGAAKAQLEKFELRITLPEVFVGKSKVLDFPADSTPICIGFRSDWGQLTVQVAMI